MPWDVLKRCGSKELAGWLALATATVVVGGASAGLAPLALKHLVDDAVRGAHGVIGPMFAYAGALLLQRACEQIQAYAYGRGESVLIRRFSALAFEHLLRLPLAEHLSRRSGALAQAISEGVLGLRLILTHLVVTALPVIVQLCVGAAVLASQLGGRQTAVLCGAILAYGLVFTLTIRRLDAPMRGASRRTLDAAATLSDGLMNVEALKAFTAEAAYAQRYDANVAATQDQWRCFLLRRLEGGAGAALVFGVAILASLLLVSADIARGALTAGDLVLVNAYLLQIVRPIELLGFAARDIGQGRGQLAALAQLLGTPTELDGRRPGPSGSGGLALAFEAVDFRHGDGCPGLSGVSFSVAAGESLAVVGPSGAGKSTLARLILGFHRPDRGEVRIDGRPIDAFGLTALRRQIALVGQDTILMNDTLAANIALGGATEPEALLTAAHAARLTALIHRLPEGLAAPVGERGLKLSGGEKQRVAIARALARRARLLVLDEATAALDLETERDLWLTLSAEAAAATKLVITHRLAIAALADRILVLDAGKVAEYGTHTELLARRGLYSRLWRTQARSEASSGSHEGEPEAPR